MLDISGQKALTWSAKKCARSPAKHWRGKMPEASRVQTLLNEQNAEIDRLHNRVQVLEAAMREVLSLGSWGTNDLARTIILEALDRKD
jgi:hypothetical protein